MRRIRVLASDLTDGVPLLWAVYDRQGRMLLQRGAVLNSEQREALLERDLYRDLGSGERAARDSGAEEPETGPPFERLHGLMRRLSALLDAVHASHPETASRAERLVADLLLLYEQYPDAMLGAVHLVREHPYNLSHPMHCAILCIMMARILDYDAKTIQSLIAAALTQNVAMLGLQAILQKQTEPLTEQQRESLNAHPREGAELLSRAGIDDELWLKAVLQHHERIAGTGYPAGLRGEEEIVEAARIISLADCYAASVSGRAYRDPLPAREGLKGLYLDQDQAWGTALTQTFIRAIGVYPPGSFVQLTNGDVGVVVYRGREALRPTVASLLAASGQPYARPLRRDTFQGEFKIRGGYRPPESLKVDPLILWEARPLR